MTLQHPQRPRRSRRELTDSCSARMRLTAADASAASAAEASRQLWRAFNDVTKTSASLLLWVIRQHAVVVFMQAQLTCSGFSLTPSLLPLRAALTSKRTSESGGGGKRRAELTKSLEECECVCVSIPLCVRSCVCACNCGGFWVAFGCGKKLTTQNCCKTGNEGEIPLQIRCPCKTQCRKL